MVSLAVIVYHKRDNTDPRELPLCCAQPRRYSSLAGSPAPLAQQREPVDGSLRFGLEALALRTKGRDVTGVFIVGGKGQKAIAKDTPGPAHSAASYP